MRLEPSHTTLLPSPRAPEGMMYHIPVCIKPDNNAHLRIPVSPERRRSGHHHVRYHAHTPHIAFGAVRALQHLCNRRMQKIEKGANGRGWYRKRSGDTRDHERSPHSTVMHPHAYERKATVARLVEASYCMRDRGRQEICDCCLSNPRDRVCLTPTRGGRVSGIN